MVNHEGKANRRFPRGVQVRITLPREEEAIDEAWL